MSELYLGRAVPKLKEWGGRLPVALVFPEAARHGLSTLGWQVVYRLLASREELAVERFFWDSTSPRPRSVDSGRDLGLFPLFFSASTSKAIFPPQSVSCRMPTFPSEPRTVIPGP